MTYWHYLFIYLFVEATGSTLKYMAICCKKQRDYPRARRMVNHLVVNRQLKPSQPTRSLEARLKVKFSEWTQISDPNRNLDDSEISYEILTKLGIHIGELGVLEVGAPPQLLPFPLPRQSTPPNPSLNDTSRPPHTKNESLTPHLSPKNQISGPSPSGNENPGPLKTNHNFLQSPLSSQKENSGPSALPKNENSNYHLLNPENENRRLFLPSETEHLNVLSTQKENSNNDGDVEHPISPSKKGNSHTGGENSLFEEERSVGLVRFTK